MADMHYTHNMGHVGYATPETTSTPPSNRFKNMANLTGAMTSLALIAGVAVWGYQLIVRDVSGIPVVRATEGEMRIRPEEPGGQLAQNTGLAVNEVAAAGEATGPVDSVTLAPRPVDLLEEDQPIPAETVAPVQQPAPLDVAASFEATPIDVSAVLQDGEVDEIVRQLTQGVTAIDSPADETTPVLASISIPEVEAAPVVTGPGPKQSSRPQLRPRTAPAVVVPASAPAPETVKDIDAGSIPAGTRLVQLGAFDTPEIARAQWDKMQGRFGDYLKGKDRIVQTAESGGRTFYRLRAHGFSDLSDARRFCSALVAEGADCIPVVTR
ncbi:SPOR domain-containing protein [uncultured Tateyamaria sp.]|uniref:SPOR domain-containing protein n=1 Tax=uncultured Tateyamaria sp. TaxID=455651 RepID=UPI002630785E|nr:SPOR domain-containing protein [uncultured Tateyamaria sp.]